MKLSNYLNENSNKLKEGDVILVQGYVMMQNLNSGSYYKVLNVSNDTYYLAKSNKTGTKVASLTSKKNRVRHSITSIDALIDSKGNNYIEKV